MKKKNLNLFIFLFVTVFLHGFMANAQTYYVTQNGTGDGSSWTNASGDLQATINAATSGSQIWVASGTYYPNRRADAPTVITPNDRNNAFVLKPNVSLYGGFLGTETSQNSAKWNYNPTILNGDIGIAGNSNDNCNVVVTSSNNMGSAVFDGFQIINGGNGMNSSGTPPQISHCVFAFNSSRGLYMPSLSSSILLQSCVFYNNTGGGAYIAGTLTVVNCLFINNSLPISSPSGATGAAVFAFSATLINSIFTGNNADYGSVLGYGLPSRITNCVMWNNPSYHNSQDTYHFYPATLTISNSYNDDVNTSVSSITSAFFNASNPIGADGLWATDDDGLKPINCMSFLGNIGSNSDVPLGTITDITGATRIQDGIVDLGPYEMPYVGIPLAPSGATNSTLNIPINFGGGGSWGNSLSSCGLICSIEKGTWSTYLSGVVNSSVVIDPSVQSSDSGMYVQRHYDIEPVGYSSNPSKSNFADVMLYYLNNEFQAYNSAVGVNAPQLPDANISATNNIQNVHIIQYHGTGTAPSNYVTTLVPAIEGLTPTSVTWNAFYNRWEILVTVSGFSGFYVNAESAKTLLPLLLISFSGSVIAQTNQLQWQTANEVNTKGFEIESSSDAVNFKAIGLVAAKGTGTYKYLDVNRGFITFYRLKMIDIDGQFTYSGIIKLGDANSGAKASMIFPNPSFNNIALNIVDQSLIGTKALLVDQSGKLLQNVIIKGASQTIDIEKYTNGIYYLKLVNGENIKVLKQ